MKKLFLFLLTSSLLIQIFPVRAQESPTVPTLPPLAINEIAAFEESGFEWLEIVNISETALDITGFSFYENETKHGLMAMTNDLLFDPNELAVIAQDSEKFLQKYPDFNGTLIDSSWGNLKEDGEEIGFMDAAENFLEKFTYLAAPDSSLERRDAKFLDYTDQNWTPHPTSATPGMQNAAARKEEIPNPEPITEPAPIPEQTPAPEPAPEPVAESVQLPAPIPNLFINEVSFRDTEADWVELFLGAQANAAVDIGGYSLWSDGVFFNIPEGTTIQPGNYFVVSLENTDGLTATTEQAILKNKEGTAFDAVCWTNGTVAQSELIDMEKIMQAEMWNSADPASCIDTAKLQKNQTIGRKILFQDTDTRDDWEIFLHASRGQENERKNNPPTAVIILQRGQTTGEAPLTVNINGESSMDPDGDTLRFLWNFGDGTFEESPNPKSHTYGTAGNYQLTLTVEDPLEAVGTASLPIQVLSKILPQEVSATMALPASSSLVKALTSSTAQSKTSETKNVKVEKKPVAKSVKKSVKKSASKTKKAAKKKTPAKKKSSEKSYRNGDLSGDVKISEVLANPEGADGEEEWIEIYNAGDRVVHLGNWSLDDDEGGSKPFLIPDTHIVEPQSYVLFTREETGLALNNTQESIRLFDFRQNLMDEISYDKAPSGKSFALVGENYEWIEDLTPGAANPKYQLVAGEVKMVDPVLHTIVLESERGSEQIAFDDKTLHPLMASLVLPKGAAVQMEVNEDGGGFGLRKINSVVPPLKEDDKTNYFPWVIGGVMTISFLVNIGLFLKNFWPQIAEVFRRWLRGD